MEHIEVWFNAALERVNLDDESQLADRDEEFCRREIDALEKMGDDYDVCRGMIPFISKLLKKEAKLLYIPSQEQSKWWKRDELILKKMARLKYFEPVSRTIIEEEFIQILYQFLSSDPKKYFPKEFIDSVVKRLAQLAEDYSLCARIPSRDEELRKTAHLTKLSDPTNLIDLFLPLAIRSLPSPDLFKEDLSLYLSSVEKLYQYSVYDSVELFSCSALFIALLETDSSKSIYQELDKLDIAPLDSVIFARMIAEKSNEVRVIKTEEALQKWLKSKLSEDEKNAAIYMVHYYNAVRMD